MSIFSCTALGALCENLCKCASCSSSCAPNCAKSVNIITVEHYDENDEISSFLNGGESLKEILENVHRQGQEIRTGIRKERMYHLAQGTAVDQVKAFQEAILAVTLECFKKIKKPSMSHEETWAKFRVACAISNVNMEVKYMRSQTLTSKEYNHLQEGVDKVSKFWDLAYYLWFIINKHKAHWSDLKKIASSGMELITQKQVKFLQNQLLHREEKRIVNEGPFSKLDRDILMIFLNASFKFSKNILNANHLQSALDKHSMEILYRRDDLARDDIEPHAMPVNKQLNYARASCDTSLEKKIDGDHCAV